MSVDHMDLHLRPGMNSEEFAAMRALLRAAFKEPDKVVPLTEAARQGHVMNRGWERSPLTPVLDYLLWFKPTSQPLLLAALQGAGLRDCAGEVVARQIGVELLSIPELMQPQPAKA